MGKKRKESEEECVFVQVVYVVFLFPEKNPFLFTRRGRRKNLFYSCTDDR